MFENNNNAKGRGPYIIAEVSQNHDGSLGQAHAYIDAVAEIGVNAIKFQTHIAAAESTYLEPFRVKFSYEDKTRYDYWKRMEWTTEQWKGLYDHAAQREIDFLSSPFSIEAVEMLDSLGVKAWKIGSGEALNMVLIDRIIESGKPIIISTGLINDNEIDELYGRIKKNGNELVIMECTTDYPTVASQIPIKRIIFLKNNYDCYVGLSDHSSTIYPSLAAAAYAADVLEVHVAFDKKMFGPDIKASVDLNELEQIVKGTKFIYEMCLLGEKKSEIKNAYETNRKIFTKSLYLNHSLPCGTEIKPVDIGIKKPFNEEGICIGDYKKVIGMKLKKNMRRDELITWGDIEK